MKSSMSRKGDCWDNAVAESFFASLKKEYIMRRKYRTRKELKADVFRYIYMFYNCYRGHSYINYKSPMDVASENSLRKAA
jgi:transposase InsO family protein